MQTCAEKEALKYGLAFCARGEEPRLAADKPLTLPR